MLKVERILKGRKGGKAEKAKEAQEAQEVKEAFRQSVELPWLLSRGARSMQHWLQPKPQCNSLLQ